MKTLSPKIVKKLSQDLNLSESTIKKNIYLLAKRYPRATKNALAQIYAQKNRKTILRMLDKEDRESLPSGIRPPTSSPPQSSGLRVLVQTDKEPAHWYNNFWIQLIAAFIVTGIFAGTIAQVLGAYFIKLFRITNP